MTGDYLPFPFLLFLTDVRVMLTARSFLFFSGGIFSVLVSFFFASRAGKVQLSTVLLARGVPMLILIFFFLSPLPE